MNATLPLFDIGRERFACFSSDRRYRHVLGRIWARCPLANFLMVNPSDADEQENDPTVERQERRSRQLGYGGLLVTNLFDFCATDPKEMLAEPSPLSLENDLAILWAARTAELVVCAWGVNGAHRGRGDAVATMLRREGVELHVLRLTKGGHPEHPLYLPYSLRPEAWRAAA